MMKNSLLNVLLFTGIANLFGQDNKPNVLFIVVDDLGWKDTECSGSRNYETPNINRIANEGTRFTRAYAASQVSSPTRASIMTGKFTARHGITNWIGEPSGENWLKWRGGRNTRLLPADYLWNLPESENTLPEVLRKNGYTTFMAGKWHLGEDPVYGIPEQHGFDINVGGCHLGGPKGGYFAPYDNPKIKNGPDGEILPIRLAEETANFIKQQSKSRKPFFAYLSFYAVHATVECTETNWNYFQKKFTKWGVDNIGHKMDKTLPVRLEQDNPVYAGLIKHVDDAIGIVLDKLKEMNLDNNTLVIFTSDNGGDIMTSNLPLRGAKGSQWEGGLRVPAILKFPRHVAAGKTCEIPVISTDFYPTILDYAGIPLMPEQHKDGLTLKSLLTEGKPLQERSLYWHYPHYGSQGGDPSSVIMENYWKLIHYYEDGRDELYNLKTDPTESKPVNRLYPEKAKSLSKKLQRWLKETNAKYPVKNKKYNLVKDKVFQQYRADSLMSQFDNFRIQELRSDYVPDKTWWGSKVVD